MKKILITLVLILLCTTGYGVPMKKPRLMVHYMPWFIAKEGSGSWGYHWTMNYFNPDQLDDEGKRKIASHYYPLIGPYDSNDVDVLEYQVLLMKYSGIDGVIIDWYGTENFYDFAILHRNTRHLIEHLKKARLQYAICYEDWTIKEMVAKEHIAKSDDIKHAQGIMKWLDANWFRDSGYLKFNNRPVLLVFGPQYFIKDEWKTIFSPLSIKPHFFPEDNILPAATGSFPWPPMWASENGVLKPERLHEYLRESYKKAKNYRYSIGAAFPCFHDFHNKKWTHDSFGYLDARDGVTYKETLETAIENESDIVQIITWNDFGEGTIIEPTREFGYKYLKITQSIRKRKFDNFFEYTSKHLRIPHQLYLLRKKHKGNKTISRKLDQAAKLFFNNKVPEGYRILQLIKVNTIEAETKRKTQQKNSRDKK